MPSSDPASSHPRLVGRSDQAISPWVTLVAREIRTPGQSQAQVFHSITQADYVCVIARTDSGGIPFVRQYRPALDRLSLELPAGLVDPQEDPAATAARELIEETGYRAAGDLTPLGCFDPDSARLENRLWGYFAGATETVRDWAPEPGVEPLLLNPEQIAEAIDAGALRHALHIAMLGVCVLRGLLDLPLSPAAPRL